MRKEKKLMSANFFKVDGRRIDSKEEFLRCETDGAWRNLIYYPERFSSDKRKPIVFRSKVFESVSFKDTDFSNVRFVRCEFQKCLFIGASVQDCEFIDCSFIATNTSKLKIKNCLIDPNCFVDNFDLVSDTNIAIGLYHALYRNSSEEHQLKHALESLYRMKQAESAHLISQKKRNVITAKKYWRDKIWNYVYDFVSGYGLRPLRVVRLLLIVIFIFSLATFFLGEFIFGETKEISIIDSIYFTVVTITTLGFGDIIPITPFGKIFVTLQALSGFSVISLFVAAVTSIALRTR